MATQSSSHVIIGRFASVYGVKGWIRIDAFTDPIENILHYNPWLIQDKGALRPITIEHSAFHGKGIIVKVSGCHDRDTAKQYVNQNIFIPRDQLPLLHEGEYYWTDLMGLSVVTTTGIPLGKVVNLLETGANDVFIVQDGAQQRLIPYTDEAVSAIDLANKLLIVDWDPEF